MKKASFNPLLHLLIVIVISFIISYLIAVYPRPFNRSYDGILFRTGLSDQNLAEKVTIHFKGKLSHNALLGHKFKGTIQINDTIIPTHPGEIELDFSAYSNYQDVTLFNFCYDEVNNEHSTSSYG